jgi:hemolysin activation/secretion protein
MRIRDRCHGHVPGDRARHDDEHNMTWLKWKTLVCLAALCLGAGGAFAQARLPERFTLTEIRVEGNTVLPALAIEQAIYPHLGPARGEADVMAARDALARVYEAEGYLSVVVQPVSFQLARNEIVQFTFRVTEGAVERLRVKGAQYNLPSQIRAASPAVAPGAVPHFPSLQTELAQLQRRADMSVTPILRPGRDPGKMEVELQVEDALALHGSLELSNRQSADTSARRLEAALRYDNLWQRQHSIGLRFINSPLDPEQVSVYSLVYSLPVGDAGRRLTLLAVQSDSDVVTAQDFGSQGRGSTVGLRFSVPLPARNSGLFHTLTAGVDYKHLKESSGLAGADTSDKPVIYTPFSLQYNALLPGETQRWTFGAGMVFGLRGLTDNQISCDGIATVDQFACRRAGAERNFSVGRFELALNQRFGKWQFEGGLETQFASGPLISSEQFSIGGRDSVRGYLESEVLGDDGARLGLQLSTPVLTPSEWPVAVHALAFYDTGWVHTQEALPGQLGNTVLASTGLGLRAQASAHVQARLDFAQALREGSHTRKGAKRLHVSLGMEF